MVFKSSVLAWIRIRIEQKCWIRIRIKSIRIHNPGPSPVVRIFGALIISYVKPTEKYFAFVPRLSVALKNAVIILPHYYLPVYKKTWENMLFLMGMGLDSEAPADGGALLAPPPPPHHILD
jgi:hypothetical protein